MTGPHNSTTKHMLVAGSRNAEFLSALPDGILLLWVGELEARTVHGRDDRRNAMGSPLRERVVKT